MNVGQVKGFMVNGRTGRLRVYGSLNDAGSDLGAVNTRVMKAITELQAALEQQYNSSQAKALLKAELTPAGKIAFLQDMADTMNAPATD